MTKEKNMTAETAQRLQYLKEIKHDTEKGMVAMDVDMRNIKRQQFKDPSNIEYQRAISQIQARQKSFKEILNIINDEILEASTK